MDSRYGETAAELQRIWLANNTADPLCPSCYTCYPYAMIELEDS